jgi:phosphatidylglycerophosphatase A
MFSFLRRYRELLIVATLLLGPLISYLISGHRGREPNFIDRTVLFASSPVQSLLTWVIDGVGALGSGYVALRGAHEEALACRTGLAEAHAELNSLKEAQAENARLKVMLAYVEDSVDQEIVARVIGGEDPGLFVLDEVVGYVVTVAIAASLLGRLPDGLDHAAAFVAFRVFDVLKLPPARQLEDLPGAWGIMADDVAAGVQAGLVLWLALPLVRG